MLKYLSIVKEIKEICVVANIKSAKKRILVTNRNNLANNARKSEIKTMIKKFDFAISEKDVVKAETLLKDCMSIINHAADDGIMHKNAAARKIATLSRKLDAIR